MDYISIMPKTRRGEAESKGSRGIDGEAGSGSSRAELASQRQTETGKGSDVIIKRREPGRELKTLPRALWKRSLPLTMPRDRWEASSHALMSEIVIQAAGWVWIVYERTARTRLVG